MIIYIALPEDPRQRELLERHAGSDRLVFGTDLPETDRPGAFREAEVVFGNVPPEWVLQSEQLAWLQLASAGYEAYLALDWTRLRDRVTLTNVGDLYGIPVAETALAGILALMRGLDRLGEAQRTRAWRMGEIRPTLRVLHGARVVILGSGAIGRALRGALGGFGCRITLLGKTSPDADIYTTDELDAVLPEADVVACCLPHAPETVGLFDRRRLELLKQGALFVNVGRGSLVDETALADLLRSGRVGGCMLDVTLIEPLPPDDPLWTCPNTILTQHTGGGSDTEWEQQVRRFLDNLARYRHGEPLKHAVRL